MPVSSKKELYLAKSMGELNDMAELPTKVKGTHAKLLVKTADKMLKEAEHQEMLHDEERAYVLFMKYFNVVTSIKKSADYKKQKAYYDDLIGTKNLVSSMDKAEQLSDSLKERYDLLEAEMVAKKFEALDAKLEKVVHKKQDVKEDSQEKKKEDTPPEIKEEPKKQEEGVVSCTTLYNLIEDRDAQLIIMDVRSISDFQESRINHKNVINVPAEAVTPGTTVTYIEKALPLDSLSLWKQRGNIDHIILLDWNTTFDRVKIGTPLQTLKDALFKYDSTVIIKSEPLVLDGGYEQWLLHYPTKCLNPDFKKITQLTTNSSQRSLLDFDYPDFEETFLKPAAPPVNQNTTGSPSSSATSQTNGTINGDLGVNGSMPRVDRSTKPKVDRSTKNNVTKSEVKSSITGSLYPDVKSAAGPITNYGKTSNYAASRDQGGISNAESRSINKEGQRSADASVSSEISDLENLKRQKQEELEDIQRKHEEMLREAEAKLERMRKEEERLSDLETLRKKQQTDVADLMRMKRSLQDSIASEKLRTQSENEKTEREEADRKRELAQIESERRKREDEVNLLRRDRKRKEDEQERLETEQKERALQEARDRSRQEEERRKGEIEAAEERARKLRLEEEHKETAREREETDRRRDETERKRKEKELQERLEREKEDRRRQLEMEQQLQERRNREEAERKQKEEKEILDRMEREKLALQEKERKEKQEKEEMERKKAEEAKRIADEKIRLMNEAARVNSKIVPSPNLQVGWEKKLDIRTNRYFYVNHNDNTTQWEPPTALQASSSSSYTTKLKEEPTERKRGLSRSNSSPNIAQLLDDDLVEKKVPVIDRGNKPIKRQEQPKPMPVKRRDLNPVYGNVGRALSGLRNLGNTCYMNSTMQCLNNTSPLVTYLLTDMYLYDINRESPLGNHGEVADDFAYIVKALWSGQYRFLSPRDFKQVVGKHQPMFAGFDQQDSQEFLTFLLDGLHEGLNKVKTRPKIPEQDNDKLSDMMGAELAWKNHKLQNESIIVELFQGQLKSTIMCLTCRKQSVTFQAFMFLSLPIPSASRCSLQDCLRQFSANEKMTGSSKWKCPQCKAYKDSVKKIEIWKVPRILLIALNRFVYEGKWRTKINANVDFPIRDLNLTEYVKGPQARPYKLYAVSNHFGTLDGGHYTACCRNPCTQKWYKFDDHEVYETSESSIKTSAAYVLYYTSIELPPPEFRPSFG